MFVIGIASLMALGAMILMASSSSSLQREARSDYFWSKLTITGREAESIGSLTDMFSSSDLVVIGRLDGVTPGRVFGDQRVDEFGIANAAWFPAATLRVERVLHSRLGPEPAVVTLELITFEQDRVPDLVDNAQPDRGVFFLRNKGVEAYNLGRSAAVQQQESEYFRLTRAEGVILERNGIAVLSPAAESSFVMELGGLPFEALVAQLSALKPGE